MFVHHHSPGRLSQFQLGTNLLDLRGLLFYCCREARNCAFQFRDPLLLVLEFIDSHLRMDALWSAYSQLLEAAVDKGRTQMTIGIDVYREGAAGINLCSINATDVCSRVIGSAGGNPADGNHILIAGETRITDIDIIAADVWIGTRSSA